LLLFSDLFSCLCLVNNLKFGMQWIFLCYKKIRGFQYVAFFFRFLLTENWISGGFDRNKHNLHRLLPFLSILYFHIFYVLTNVKGPPKIGTLFWKTSVLSTIFFEFQGWNSFIFSKIFRPHTNFKNQKCKKVHVRNNYTSESGY